MHELLWVGLLGADPLFSCDFLFLVYLDSRALSLYL